MTLEACVITMKSWKKRTIGDVEATRKSVFGGVHFIAGPKLVSRIGEKIGEREDDDSD